MTIINSPLTFQIQYTIHIRNTISFTKLTKSDYYISNLNCNLIVKENIEKKKKLIEALSKKVECYLKRAQHIKTILPK